MLAHSYKNTLHIVAPPTLTSGSIILHKLEYTLPKAASTQFTAFLLDYFFKKTFLRNTLTPHCGPNLIILPKDVFIFQQSLQLSFKINVGEEFSKYFKIIMSPLCHYVPIIYPGLMIWTNLNLTYKQVIVYTCIHSYVKFRPLIVAHSTPPSGIMIWTILNLHNLRMLSHKFTS